MEKHIGDYAGRLVDRKLTAKERRESALKLLKLISSARIAAEKSANAIVTVGNIKLRPSAV